MRNLVLSILKFIIHLILPGGMRNCTQEWIKNEVPSQCLSSTEEYNIAADTWSHGPHLPWPLCAAGVIKYYSTIYVIGKVYLIDPLGAMGHGRGVHVSTLQVN